MSEHRSEYSIYFLLRISEDLTVNNFLETPLNMYHLEEDLYTPGNLLYSDKRKIQSTDSKYKSLIVGTLDGYAEGVGSAAKFDRLTGFTQTSPTQIVIADQYNHCIRDVNRLTRQSSTLVGNCTNRGYTDGESAQFFRPYAVINSDDDTLLVTEWGNKAVRSIDLNTLNVTTLIPPGPYAYYGIVKNSETRDLYMTITHGVVHYDYIHKTTERISGSSVSGSNDAGFSNLGFNSPRGITFLSKDVLVVADQMNHKLRVLDLSSNTSSSICSGIQGQQEGNVTSCRLSEPLAVMVVGDTLYVGATERIMIIRSKY